MLKFICTLAVLIFSQQSYADRLGNAGAGISENGIDMTFTSAGIKINVNPKPLTFDEIPSMALVYREVANLELSTDEKMALSQNLLPGANRKYYAVNEEKFDAESREKLISLYSGITKQDPKKIILFAITDPSTSTTYLFPAFFKLKTVAEHAAILFHELYWVYQPKSDYETVMSAEADFQLYLEDKTNPEKILNFARRVEKMVGSVGSAFIYSFFLDIKNGSLKDFYKDNAIIPLPNLLGKKFRTNSEYYFYITDLSLKYPNSLFLKELAYLISRGVRAGTLSMENSLNYFHTLDSVFPNIEIPIPTKSFVDQTFACILAQVNLSGLDPEIKKWINDKTTMLCIRRGL